MINSTQKKHKRYAEKLKILKNVEILCFTDNPVILGDEKERVNNLNHICILCL